MNRDEPTRHLTWDSLNRYLQSGSPAIVPIVGEPALQLTIEPAIARLAVRSPWAEAGEIPDLVQFLHLDTKVGTGTEGDWIEFGISGAHVLQEAYQLLVLLADRIQIQNDTMGKAIGHLISTYRELLSALGGLNHQQEIGLYGELLILKYLISSLNESVAISSWAGPSWEEHDFGLSNLDLEVKTTTAERRSHVISSLTQLEPSHERKLWLVSIQLTSIGERGSTLTELIRSVKSGIEYPKVKKELENKLAAYGWIEGANAQYLRKYSLRSKILMYHITENFPAITRTALQMAGVSTHRITNVHYVLQLDDLTPNTPPDQFKDLTNYE